MEASAKGMETAGIHGRAGSSELEKFGYIVAQSSFAPHPVEGPQPSGSLDDGVVEEAEVLRSAVPDQDVQTRVARLAEELRVALPHEDGEARRAHPACALCFVLFPPQASKASLCLLTPKSQRADTDNIFSDKRWHRAGSFHVYVCARYSITLSRPCTSTLTTHAQFAYSHPATAPACADVWQPAQCELSKLNSQQHTPESRGRGARTSPRDGNRIPLNSLGWS